MNMKGEYLYLLIILIQHRKQRNPQYYQQPSPPSSPEISLPPISPIILEEISENNDNDIRKVVVGLINCPAFPEEFPLKKPFITINEKATILVLKKYIANVFNCSESNVNIYVLKNSENERPYV